MMDNFLYKWLNKFLSGDKYKELLFSSSLYTKVFQSSNNLIRYGNLTIFWWTKFSWNYKYYFFSFFFEILAVTINLWWVYIIFWIALILYSSASKFFQIFQPPLALHATFIFLLVLIKLLSGISISFYFILGFYFVLYFIY